MIDRWDRLYEPLQAVAPWPLRPMREAGGLTPVGVFSAFLLALPVVLGGVLLAWGAFGP